MRRVKWWVRGMGQRLFPRLTLALLANRTWLLEPEIGLLPYLSDRKGVAVDAGANKGVYVFHLARHFQRVIAFEPLPAMSRYLKRAAPSNVKVHDLALSRSAGSAVLSLPRGYNELASLEAHPKDLEWKSDSHLETHEVELAPLDRLGLRDVNLIKIDVEGHELAVLEGARSTIQHCRPTLLIEVEERHSANSVARVDSYLKGLGYAGYFLDGSSVKPISAFDKARDQNLDALDHSVRVGRYINNFIFFDEREVPRRLAALEVALTARDGTAVATRTSPPRKAGAREKLASSYRAALDALVMR